MDELTDGRISDWTDLGLVDGLNDGRINELTNGRSSKWNDSKWTDGRISKMD